MKLESRGQSFAQQQQQRSFPNDSSLGDQETLHLLQRVEKVAASLLFSLLSLGITFLTAPQQEIVTYSIHTLQELLEGSGRPPSPLAYQHLPRIEYLTGTVALLSYLYHQLDCRCKYRAAMASLASNLKHNSKEYTESCEAYVHQWIRNGWQPKRSQQPQQQPYHLTTQPNFNVEERLAEHFETSNRQSLQEESNHEDKHGRRVRFSTIGERGESHTNSPSSVTTYCAADPSSSPLAAEKFPTYVKQRDFELMPPPLPPPLASSLDRRRGEVTPEELRSKQQRNKDTHTQRLILSLYHSSRCTNDSDQPCPVSRYCNYYKQLWSHMSVGGCCRNGPCKVPRCREAKHALTHFRNCQLLDCSICVPVKVAIPQMKRDMEIATTAVSKCKAKPSVSPSRSPSSEAAEPIPPKDQETTSDCSVSQNSSAVRKSVPLKKRPVPGAEVPAAGANWSPLKEHPPLIVPTTTESA